MDLAQLAKDAAVTERTRLKILRSGFTVSGHKLWTDEEDLICRIFHPDYSAICQVLHARSRKAVQTRCQRLGLAPRREAWGWSARQKLRKLYPDADRKEICDAFPGVSWDRIQAAARYYGFRRSRKPYKLTGIPALDQLRSRCYAIRWIMRDMDEEAGTGQYFQTRGYKSRSPDFNSIDKGVRALGGHLEVRWDDAKGGHVPPDRPAFQTSLGRLTR
jgi:hypothetical protein